MSENKSHENVEQIEENEEIEVNRVKSLKTNVKGGDLTDWIRTMRTQGTKGCISAEEISEF
jgi:hypothetical protein